MQGPEEHIKGYQSVTVSKIQTMGNGKKHKTFFYFLMQGKNGDMGKSIA